MKCIRTICPDSALLMYPCFQRPRRLLAVLQTYKLPALNNASDWDKQTNQILLTIVGDLCCLGIPTILLPLDILTGLSCGSFRRKLNILFQNRKHVDTRTLQSISMKSGLLKLLSSPEENLFDEVTEQLKEVSRELIKHIFDHLTRKFTSQSRHISTKFPIKLTISYGLLWMFTIKSI